MMGSKSVIPNDWEIKQIGDIGTVIRGASPRPQGDPRYYGGNVPRLMVEDVTRDGKYVTPKIDFLTDEGAKKSRPCRAGVLTIVCSGGVGVPSFLAVDACIHDGFLALLDIDKSVNEDYLFYQIYRLKERLERSATHGGVFTNLTTSILKEFEISIPPLPEQKAIAQVLSTADAAIQTTEKLIAQKELRKKWLMQQLLTGKKRLKGFEGEWKEMHLGDFIIESRIPSINNDVNRRITVKLNLKGIEKRDVRGSEAEDATYYFIRKKNQFIYGKQNLHKGAFGIIPNELDGFESSQDIPAFDFQDGVNSIYFMFYMSQESFYQSLEKISTGTGSKRIHPENLYKVKVKFPSIEEQTAIAQVLQAADKEISLLKAKAEKLREQKKGLMQVLLTGKVRLKIN